MSRPARFSNLRCAITSRAGALFAGPDGLDDYRVLIPQLPGLLAPGGAALVEIGASQADAVMQLARSWQGWRSSLHRDLAGRHELWKWRMTSVKNFTWHCVILCLSRERTAMTDGYSRRPVSLQHLRWDGDFAGSTADVGTTGVDARGGERHAIDRRMGIASALHILRTYP
jgi:hypothetical protein